MNQNNSNLPKTFGVLMHPTSLPGSPVCGTFGAPSRNWIKLLSQNSIGVWQILPLAPVDKFGSPYSSPSSFAYSPWFLDADDLIAQDFMPADVLKDLPGSENINNSVIDFELAELRVKAIGEYLRIYWADQTLDRHEEFDLWKKSQSWLEKHSFFMELRRINKEVPWWNWEEKFANYDLFKEKSVYLELTNNLLEHQLLQWHLHRQWSCLRKLANNMGIKILGDLPFYVSRDSSDVWANSSLFSIKKDGGMQNQSGVPPDYFSETGQLWGTPVYRWQKHKTTRYGWWRGRIKRHLEQVDLLRIDHFRALDSYWSIPGGDKTAKSGSWRSSPGLQILNRVRRDNQGKLPLIAEDLGVITSRVSALRDYFHLPGMKILQFAFDGNTDNPYLPKNIRGNNWIVYPGTHDNAPTNAWWESLNEKSKNFIGDIIGDKLITDEPSPNWKLIDIGLSTDAKIFICTLQDLLGLGEEGRINRPGSLGGNWNWRMKVFDNKVNEVLNKYSEKGKYWKRSFRDASKLI